MNSIYILLLYMSTINVIYFSEKIVVSLDLRAKLPDTKIKDEKNMKFSIITLGLIGAR